MEETRFFSITVSFGSVSSSISLPCYMSHASIPAEVRVSCYTLTFCACCLCACRLHAFLIWCSLHLLWCSSVLRFRSCLTLALFALQVRAARGLPDDLIRISAGIEDIDDLLAGALLCASLQVSLPVCPPDLETVRLSVST